MSSINQERRQFLGILLSLPVALSLGCTSKDSTTTVPSKVPTPEQALTKVIRAVGPWTNGEREKAEDFAHRFLAAECAVSSYMPAYGKQLQALAGRFPEEAFALKEIDLGELSPEERDLLKKLVEQLYTYVEVRFFVSLEPPWGDCQLDRMRYTRSPA